ncbi:MAG: hypothetical protein RIT04_577 [Candidatus Parcubacteria bacterium]|jgi:methylenetetrahydrofolate dehydrogenase (NADP+)/methenyltetrahydrofolate cyclohydrolase
MTIDEQKTAINKPKILDGRIARESIKQGLIARIKTVLESGQATLDVPKLVIIQVGDRADSNVYIAAKKKFAEEIGVVAEHVLLSETISQDEIVARIDKLNGDAGVHGIIVQLPLPVGLNRDGIINTIDPKKDVDGLTTAQNTVDARDIGSTKIWPATARGISELLAYYEIPLAGKNVTIIGRSALVGKPTAQICTAAGASVTVLNSTTSAEDFAVAVRNADIVVSAVGKPRLVRAEHVRAGQVIVDVGTTAVSTSDGKRKIIGDVDFTNVSAVIGASGAITPVPGGVGAMTVLALFENLVDAWYNEYIINNNSGE